MKTLPDVYGYGKGIIVEPDEDFEGMVSIHILDSMHRLFLAEGRAVDEEEAIYAKIAEVRKKAAEYARIQDMTDACKFRQEFPVLPPPRPPWKSEV